MRVCGVSSGQNARFSGKNAIVERFIHIFRKVGNIAYLLGLQGFHFHANLCSTECKTES